MNNKPDPVSVKVKWGLLIFFEDNLPSKYFFLLRYYPKMRKMI
jgi:hypothetical protein